MKAGIFAVIGISVLVLGAAMFGRTTSTNSEVQSGKSNREVALTCTTDMATEFHIHPILEIIANGEKQTIPADIGIRQGCMNALHTHDMVGTIHVESPEKRDFTLGDFFAVWEQPFSKNKILSYVADETHRIRVSVNGVDVDTFENTVLEDGDRIIISYEPI